MDKFKAKYKGFDVRIVGVSLNPTKYLIRHKNKFKWIQESDEKLIKHI